VGSQDKADGDRERLEIHISILSLRGANKVRDAAIHRVSREADEFVYSRTGSQWIATGLRPRDEKVGSDGSVRFGYNTILSL